MWCESLRVLNPHEYYNYLVNDNFVSSLKRKFFILRIFEIFLPS